MPGPCACRRTSPRATDFLAFERAEAGTLTPAGAYETGGAGDAPKSVAEHEGLVYVLNTGAPSLIGFRLSGSRIEPLAGSTRELED